MKIHSEILHEPEGAFVQISFAPSLRGLHRALEGVDEEGHPRSHPPVPPDLGDGVPPFRVKDEDLFY